MPRQVASRTLVLVAILAVILAASSFSPVAANDEVPEIKITKLTTNGDTTTVFHFIVSDEWSGTFDLFGGGHKSIYYGPGRYVIIEEVPPGWVLDVTCAVLDDDSAFEYLPGRGVIIILFTVYAGTVECTFTNSPAGPVGGVVEPVNTFALPTQYVALVGLFAAATVAAVVVFRKEKKRVINSDSRSVS